ncbi:hypothetical protein [Anaerobiospirillum sp. NML120449]|uniref:hypothetical protein n=1 Tax=Anaerobiospirillum sp. NML120449 TaxID=2932817 RepID=UPI001FF6CED1|nr:hypothetical protein [Anaerobiospirillum sp. NML120449]MCK0525424.1 hypothetical protein [Anaerobiospirillum sp. NML120449]
MSSSDALSVNSRNNAKLITQTRAVYQELDNMANRIPATCPPRASISISKNPYHK